MMYAPGMRVVIRDEEWVIKRAETNTLGNQTLYVQGISKLVNGRESIFLTDLETIDVIEPEQTDFVIDTSGMYMKSRLYIESQWRQKIPTDDSIHLGHLAAMDAMKYQLEPAQMALEKPRQRILIADATGLGKTLEAGILMSELIARGKGKRILVVTVKSMMAQFQKEMWSRFTIPLVRLDSARIQKIRSQIPSNYNPFSYFDKSIISVDTLKRDIEYRTHLENAYWDIIVIDEAQNVARRANGQAQRSKLAELLAKRSDTMIMLSATPHDGSSESFASLMRMLDPTAIADPKHYTKNDVEGLCIRRFKKDIKGQASSSTFKEAKFVDVHTPASSVEEAVFDKFSNMKLKMDEEAEKHGGQLFKILLLKSLFSSPASCVKTVETRLKKLYKVHKDGLFEDIAVLEDFLSSVKTIEKADFSRYNALVNLLKSSDYGWNPSDTSDRVVIFTERIETMRYLADNLRQDLKSFGISPDAIVEIHGGMSDKDQQDIVDQFGRKDSKMRVLVGSDVVSEGINLHYLSHRMVHFDIPWSLMVFQQRNGRIDRYGQEKVPDIRYLFVDSKNEEIHGDVRILEVLKEKEQRAMENIGDPASLLNLYDPEAESQYIEGVIASGTSAEQLSAKLDGVLKTLNPFELLMASTTAKTVKTAEDHTLYSDEEYLEKSLKMISEIGEGIEYRPLSSTIGLEMIMNRELNARMHAILPDEALHAGDTIYLSPDKQYCMEDMVRGRSKNIIDASWPDVQYLWKLHPIFDWINDKTGILFGRQQAPLIGSRNMRRDEMIFLMSGSIPNRRSTPLVDEWFAIHVLEGQTEILTVTEALKKASFIDEGPNELRIDDGDLAFASDLKMTAIKEGRIILNKKFEEFQARMNPKLASEKAKLEALREKHMDRIEKSKMLEFQADAKRHEIESIFKEFNKWVEDSMSIQNVPYIRIIAAFKGVQ